MWPTLCQSNLIQHWVTGVSGLGKGSPFFGTGIKCVLGSREAATDLIILAYMQFVPAH